MEPGFLFGITTLEEELAPQLSQVLRYCADFSSRQKLHALWELTDRLNQVPKPTPEVLAKRRRREGIWGVMLWVLSIFVLIPSAMDPAALTGLLVLGVLSFFMSCAAMRSTKRNLMAGLNLVMGAVLCFGAILAFEQLKPLLAPGILCLMAGVWVLIEKTIRRKSTSFDRQARELLWQRRTIADMERMQVEFTDQGMRLSDGTQAGEHQFTYEEFWFVGETKDLLVPVCGQRAIVLKKTDLRCGSMEQLRTFLQERIRLEQMETP